MRLMKVKSTIANTYWQNATLSRACLSVCSQSKVQSRPTVANGLATLSLPLHCHSEHQNNAYLNPVLLTDYFFNQQGPIGRVGRCT